MFKQSWSTEYAGHKIRVDNSWFGSSELYVDEKLQDKSMGMFSGKLVGKIHVKDSEKELKVVISPASLMSLECLIFVDNEVIYSSKK